MISGFRYFSQFNDKSGAHHIDGGFYEHGAVPLPGGQHPNVSPRHQVFGCDKTLAQMLVAELQNAIQRGFWAVVGTH
jgi:hypothetical protein